MVGQLGRDPGHLRIGVLRRADGGERRSAVVGRVVQRGHREAESRDRGEHPDERQGRGAAQRHASVPGHDRAEASQGEGSEHEKRDEQHRREREQHDRGRGVERVAEQAVQRAGVGPVDDWVEGPVQREVEAHVERLRDHHQRHHDPEGDRGDVARPGRQQRGERDEHDDLERQASEGERTEVLDPVGQRQADPEQHHCQGRERCGERRVDDLAVAAAPQPPDLAAEGLREQGERDHEEGLDEHAGQHPGRGDDEHDALERGDDLGPVARRRRPPQPRQHLLGGEQQVTGQSDGEHPRARRPGDVHAEHEDQEGVDLHVEAGAERRLRVCTTRHLPVHPVEQQRDGADEDQRSDLGRPEERPDDQRGHEHGKDTADERDHVGRADTREHPVRQLALNRGHSDSVQVDTGVGTTQPVGWFNDSREGFHVMGIEAHAFWVREPGVGEIRPVALRDPGQHDVLVRAVVSGVSRGTEAVVFDGRVPEGQRAAMRAPFQDGDFPGPVKYGYLSVGVVEEGPEDLLGRPVFCLHPHQTRYVVPAASVHLVPDGVPARRAVLAGTLETAVNALWDAAPLVGDRVTVIGAGMVGCCVARLLSRIPGVQVTLVDVDLTRAEVATGLGVGFAQPDEAPTKQDLVVHTSATSAGLQRSLDLLVAEGTVVDLSWYGDTEVQLSLGGRFHSDRLSIRSSQVGTVATARRGRRTTAERMALALELLRDPAYDVLLTGSSRFEELPDVMPLLASGKLAALCHTITYEGE